jgi:hypothetical protein
MTVELDPGAATPAEAAKRLGVAAEDLDADYGVVPVDPDNHLYSVLVDEEAGAAAGGREGVEGPFSNPRIEPFGPPG